MADLIDLGTIVEAPLAAAAAATAAATTAVPGWVSLCGHMAPMAAIVVFFAVSFHKFKRFHRTSRLGCNS
jgi:hypothetical protein